MTAWPMKICPVPGGNQPQDHDDSLGKKMLGMVLV